MRDFPPLSVTEVTADTVENAEALSIRLQNEKDAHEVQYNGAKGEVAVYRAEVAQLVADRATAKGAYEAADIIF